MKIDFALNNLQCLMCHKINRNQSGYFCPRHVIREELLDYRIGQFSSLTVGPTKDSGPTQSSYSSLSVVGEKEIDS